MATGGPGGPNLGVGKGGGPTVRSLSIVKLTASFDVPFPLNQYDWPLPQAPVYSIYLRTWAVTGPVYFPVTPPPPADTDTIRAPYFSPPRQPQTLLYDIPPNLLTSALKSQSPFSQDDWPLARAPLQSALTWTWQYNPNLIGKDAFPPGEVSTALPTKGYEFSVSLRTWTSSPQPVSVAVVVDTSVHRAPYFSPPRAPAPLLASLFVNPLTLRAAVTVQVPFNQYIWPLTSSALRSNDLATWISQTKLLLAVPLRQLDWPLTKAPLPQTQSWTASYNLNLIGQDFLPVGKDVVDLPPQLPLPAVQLRTWINTVNLALTSVVSAPFAQYSWPLTPAAIRGTDLSTWISQVKLLLAVPFNQEDWPLPKQRPPAALSWTAWYNLNLIGQDKLPVGEVVTDLPPRAPQQPTPIFIASYNNNLIGKDQLPTGSKQTDLPPQPALSAIQLRTWINSVALALVTAPPVKPFNQQDWPLNFGPRQPIQIFTASYNQNLIGKDQLPTGEIVTDLPPRQPQQPTPIFAAAYNKNLIGQDQLPTGNEITALPPQPALSAIQLRTWIQTVNLALVTTPAVLPFNQYDWPLNIGPRQPVQVFTTAYNKNLTGQDQLPVGEINTTLPAQQQLAAQTWINAVNLALTTVAALPFNQTTWPLNAGPRQPDRSYGSVFPRVLVGQDRLPFRQQDWPLYRPFLQPAYGYSAWYNRNLVGKDRLPTRQMHWPVPPEFRRLSDWIARTNPNLFVPPIPPPEILPRDPTHLRTRGGFEIDARGQASLDQRGAGVDARGPASVERRGSGRFNRGKNES